MKTVIEGVKLGYQLSQTKGFQSIGSTLIEYLDCGHIEKFTDPYWECMIGLYSQTNYHPSGKCLQILMVMLMISGGGTGHVKYVENGVLSTTIEIFFPRYHIHLKFSESDMPFLPLSGI